MQEITDARATSMAIIAARVARMDITLLFMVIDLIELIELIGLIGLVGGALAGVVGEDFCPSCCFVEGVVGVAAEGAGAHEVDVGVDIVGGTGGVAGEVAAGGAGDGLRLWGCLGHRWGCLGTAESGCRVFRYCGGRCRWLV